MFFRNAPNLRDVKPLVGRVGQQRIHVRAGDLRTTALQEVAVQLTEDEHGPDPAPTGREESAPDRHRLGVVPVPGIGHREERARLDRAAALGVSRSEALRRGILAVAVTRYGGILGDLADEGYLVPPQAGPGEPPPSAPLAPLETFLAELAEDRRPPAAIWQEELVTSRLLEYELWTRIHARELDRSHGDLVRLLLARLAILDLHPDVLDRATRPFPVPVRTLDALHLASVVFLRERGRDVTLATCDRRMREAATAMGIPLMAEVG